MVNNCVDECQCRYRELILCFLNLFPNFTFHFLQIMRSAISIFLLLLLPVVAMAQRRSDYKEAMTQIMQCYNSNDANALSNLFSPKSHDRAYYTRGRLGAIKSEYRDIVSFHYLRQREDGVVIFTVRFAKYQGKYRKILYPDNNGYVGLALDKDNKIMRLKLPASAGNEPRYLFKTEGLN